MYIADSARRRSLSDARSLRSESISPSGLVTSRKKFARSQNHAVTRPESPSLRRGSRKDELKTLRATARAAAGVRRCSESSCTAHVHCGSCAPAATGRDSLATLWKRFSRLMQQNLISISGGARNPHSSARALRFLRAGGHRQRLDRDAAVADEAGS